MDMNGVIIINKPSGISSSDVVLKAKRILGVRKVGHTGTLDPLATGVLPLCINEGTKLAPFFADCEKEYVATLRLGIETDTQDREGKIIQQTEAIPQDVDRIQRIVQEFRGIMLQTPPMFSALKHKGVPLYRIARAGGWVARNPRTVTISGIEILACALPFITLRVQCSAGTYIRTLCSDIGRKLSCGAHLVDLQRVRNGTFHIKDAVPLEALQEGTRNGHRTRYLIPLNKALGGLPEVVVDNPLITQIRHGVQSTVTDVGGIELPPAHSGQKAKIVTAQGQLLAVVEFLMDTEQAASCAPHLRVWKILRTFMN